MKVRRKPAEKTVVRFGPEASDGADGPVGRPLDRVDGAPKVTGEATYTAEYRPADMAYAALVCSTVARGRISSIDRSAAEGAEGVIAIVTHENAPRMQSPPLWAVPQEDGTVGAAARTMPVMQGDAVSWNGEPVAVVVAGTQEQAEHAASLVEVAYRSQDAAVSFDNLKAGAGTPETILGEPPEIEIGNAEFALGDAEVSVDRVYRTPRHNHGAIEPHATIAAWDDDGNLTAFDSTQSLHDVKNTLAKVFGVAPGKVRVIAPYVGGAFGGKLMMWNNTVLCAAAAKAVGRPVKLVLSREDVFRVVGGRTLTEQRVALGAHRDGRLAVLIHTGTTAVVADNAFPEQFSFPARHLYAADNFYIGQKTVNLDTVANTAMRAPGEAPGSFALESAIDELAHALDMDPVELRVANEPDKDPTSGAKFSMRNLLEAHRRGAARFGWKRREPRSRRDGEWLVGQGMASCFYPHFQLPSAARVRVFANGTALVQAALQEMGVGAATVQIQHAAHRLGLPVDSVSVEYGETDLPVSPGAGGSASTASVAAAVAAAVEKLHGDLLALAGDDSSLSGLSREQIEARDGGLFEGGNPDRGETYASILRRAGRDHAEAEGLIPTFPQEMFDYSMHSWGAQFCEVRVREETGEVRVSRWVGSFDCGRILNPKTAASQFRGGIVTGIGMALTEEVSFDERSGRVMNPSLAEYHVPVHLDVPPIDVIFNDIPDEHAPLGMHGVGEIGTTGAAAAVANAVYNATGRRVRELPITLDKLL